MTDTSDPNNLPEPTHTSSGPVASSSSAANLTGDYAAMSPVVNLQVVSPSSQVRSPLSFQSLPATTSVKELKEKIRNALEVSPSAESQRLIYRGRMLARDTETMMEIFGEETLRNSDHQTFHLVLRPPISDNLQESTSTPALSSNPASNLPATNLPGPLRSYGTPEYHGNLPPVQPSARRIDGRSLLPPQQFQALQAQNEMQHRLVLQRLQAEHQELTEQLNSYLHQDPGTRSAENFANGRLPHGPQHASAPQLPHIPGITPQGAQHPSNLPGNQQYALPVFQNLLAQQQQQAIRHGPPSRTQSPLHHGHTPDHTTTFTRQGVNSNGERWQITVNESTTVIPPGNNHHQVPLAATGDLATNMQHLLHSAERLAAMATRLNNLTQRPGGLPTPPGMAPGMAPGNAPQRPSSTPPTGRSVRPNAASTNSFPTPSAMPSMASLPPSLSSDSPTVYIMSSPNGPQALLMHNSQTFFSTGVNIGQQPSGSPLPGLVGEVRNRRDRTHRHRHRHRDANAQPADGAAAAPQAQAGQVPLAQPHAQVRGFAIWPNLWLIVRLLIFIWYFTSGGNTSWSRLFIIWGMSLFLFILNTGAFNDVLGTFWNPIRQHLENLLPLAGQNNPEAVPPRGNAENAAGDATVRNPEPNPEEVARRLLEQRRRQDASWLMTQFRRVEHAVLLFVASIVPGTAERHIEARTIEENRLLEQRRQEAAAAAAALEATRVENQEGEAASVPNSVQAESVSGNEQGDGPVARVEQEQVAVA